MLLAPPVIGQPPYLMNHLGERVFEFPLDTPTELPTKAQQTGGHGWGGDTGLGYRLRAIDLDGDEKDEILFYTRKEIKVFKVR